MHTCGSAYSGPGRAYWDEGLINVNYLVFWHCHGSVEEWFCSLLETFNHVDSLGMAIGM